MEKCTIYSFQGLYRDDFRIEGVRYGKGENTLCILGTTRGNENQQLLVSAMLVDKLKVLEEAGRFQEGKSVLVIPCTNNYSMNIKKRFWPIDNTDINRMFPGYDKGETTQRIAAGIFDTVKDFAYGIQFASFYRPGAFVPHVRIMKTGYEAVEDAKKFGLPYVVVHTPRPFDTTTLNYNWQIWDTKAFSLYTTNTDRLDHASAGQAVKAVLNFMAHIGILDYEGEETEEEPRVVFSEDFLPIRAEHSGFFEAFVSPGERVKSGQLLGTIRNPFDYALRSSLFSPIDGVVGFVSDEPMVYQHSAVIKVIKY